MWNKWKYALTNHCETRENHEDVELRSHYYKAANRAVMAAVKELLASLPGAELLSVSEERGEICAQTKRGKSCLSSRQSSRCARLKRRSTFP